MTRKSIEDVGEPPDGCRVDKHVNPRTGLIGFEDEQSCRREDERRIRTLEAALKAGKLNRWERRSAPKLIKNLRRGLADERRRLTAASRLAMRRWRMHVSGWSWSHVDQLDPDYWVFFTLVLPSWWVRSRGLHGLSAKRLIERLRVALARAGSGDASGWLFAMIHGEYDGDTRGYSLHVHGIATEGMIGVLRALRKQPQFRRNKIDRKRYPQVGIAKKLVIERPRDVPAVVTYTSKSYWPQHDSRVEADGVRRRVGKKHRITSGTHLARCLLWLHANPVKDQVLLVHLSVINGALVPGKRGVRDSD